MPRESTAPFPIPEMKPREFARIQGFAYDHFGLDLRSGKERLVSSRLAKPIRAGGFRSFGDYLEHVVSDASGEAAMVLVDALTTNHTSFLREKAHFQFLCDTILPQYAGRNRFEIWCAASSTGEEAYSLLFSLLDAIGPGGRPAVEIMATDISTRVLAAARLGVYPADRVEKLSREWQRCYFLKGQGASTGFYKVKAEIARSVTFTRLNLIEQFSPQQLWPVIFCRNVMIYFDRPTQARLVRRLSECLEPGGYLFVGHAESLTGFRHDLKPQAPAIYRKSCEKGILSHGR